jgi:hypothetical protein
LILRTKRLFSKEFAFTQDGSMTLSRAAHRFALEEQHPDEGDDDGDGSDVAERLAGVC